MELTKNIKIKPLDKISATNKIKKSFNLVQNLSLEPDTKAIYPVVANCAGATIRYRNTEKER